MSNQTINWPTSAAELATMEWVALGAVRPVLAEYGLDSADFFRAHPECLCHRVPAEAVRQFAISGGLQ
jgi:hypothetical protein